MGIWIYYIHTNIQIHTRKYKDKTQKYKDKTQKYKDKTQKYKDKTQKYKDKNTHTHTNTKTHTQIQRQTPHSSPFFYNYCCWIVFYKIQNSIKNMHKTRYITNK
jgi:hypothetical protein